MTKLIKGYTLMHEHITIDLSGVKNDLDCRLDCYDETLIEFKELYRNGVRNIVDVTNRGMGLNRHYVEKIAQESGINIIQATGFYKVPFLPSDLANKSVQEIADEMINDIRNDSSIGIIGEIGTSLNEWKKEELAVFEAAIIAHQATKKPIYTHTTIGTLGLEQAHYFISKKLDPKRIVIGHMDLSKDLDVIKQVIDLGFFVGFDTIGKNDYFPDEKRIEFLLELEKTNRIHGVVLSEDLTRKSHLNYKGGIGYNYLFTHFIPECRKAGMKESSIEQMLITNPEIIFAE
jgi:phosphotriesterase-related protein